jgi:ribonuclease HII
MWKGDRVAACISAASVLAKVTRDRMMVALDRDHPAYDFKTHKGYVTDVHNAALLEHGPCPEHRMRFVNVRRATRAPARSEAPEGREKNEDAAAWPDTVDAFSHSLTRVDPRTTRGESA